MKGPPPKDGLSEQYLTQINALRGALSPPQYGHLLIVTTILMLMSIRPSFPPSCTMAFRIADSA